VSEGVTAYANKGKFKIGASRVQTFETASTQQAAQQNSRTEAQKRGRESKAQVFAHLRQKGKLETGNGKRVQYFFVFFSRRETAELADFRAQRNRKTGKTALFRHARNAKQQNNPDEATHSSLTHSLTHHTDHTHISSIFHISTYCHSRSTRLDLPSCHAPVTHTLQRE
jgi:hypothetical protein